MKEALMDHKMLRRLVLEQKLIDYVRTDEQPYGTRLFECGPEFGIAHFTWRVPAGWCLEWRSLEECPVDLSKLPKEGE